MHRFSRSNTSGPERGDRFSERRDQHAVGGTEQVVYEDTYGHTPSEKAFERADVYGIAYDEERAARRPIRFGVIGSGGVAQSKYLPAVARLRMVWEPIEVVVFAEPREEQAKKVQAVYGGEWYADYRQMLERSEIDGVLVLGPDDLHAEHTIASLESGRHVLVEKPISRSLAAAHRMCRIADERGLTLMTVATMRFSPPYRRARRFIHDGPVAHPAMFAGKFNLGYDYVDLLESGTIHLYDLCRYLMGDVRTVHAVGVNRYGKGQGGYPVDNVVTALQFVSGAIGTLYTSRSALSFKPWMRVEVYGDHAWLTVDDGYELLLYEGEQEAARSWKPVMPNTLLFDEEFGGFMGLVENFAQVIRGQERPLVTGWDGYRALEMLVATQISLAQGRTVTLPLDPGMAQESAATWLQREVGPGSTSETGHR